MRGTLVIITNANPVAVMPFDTTETILVGDKVSIPFTHGGFDCIVSYRHLNSDGKTWKILVETIPGHAPHAEAAVEKNGSSMFEKVIWAD